VLWLIFCGIDYTNGVRAGFGAGEEFGIHLVMFVVPVIGARVAARHRG
jgi:hypothetical protein